MDVKSELEKIADAEDAAQKKLAREQKLLAARQALVEEIEKARQPGRETKRYEKTLELNKNKIHVIDLELDLQKLLIAKESGLTDELIHRIHQLADRMNRTEDAAARVSYAKEIQLLHEKVTNIETHMRAKQQEIVTFKRRTGLEHWEP